MRPPIAAELMDDFGARVPPHGRLGPIPSQHKASEKERSNTESNQAGAAGPWWWFRPIGEAVYLEREPTGIEYLNAATGETVKHSGGTAYWKEGEMDIRSLALGGWTHWRILPFVDGNVRDPITQHLRKARQS